MKKFFVLVSVMVLPLVHSSCHWNDAAEKKRNAAREAYIKDSKTKPAAVNVEGVYFTKGWGLVVLKQRRGGQVSGVIGTYGNLRGVVSGKSVYLYQEDDGATDYTFQLAQTRPDQLKGFFSAHVPFSAKDQQEIVLEKIRP